MLYKYLIIYSSNNYYNWPEINLLILILITICKKDSLFFFSFSFFWNAPQLLIIVKLIKKICYLVYEWILGLSQMPNMSWLNKRWIGLNALAKDFYVCPAVRDLINIYCGNVKMKIFKFKISSLAILLKNHLAFARRVVNLLVLFQVTIMYILFIYIKHLIKYTGGLSIRGVRIAIAESPYKCRSCNIWTCCFKKPELRISLNNNYIGKIFQPYYGPCWGTRNKICCPMMELQVFNGADEMIFTIT